MLPAGLVGHVRLRYVGTSAQKARLVVDLVRGRQVGEALATLSLTHKAVARDVLKALESAVANARQKKPDIDIDRLFVKTAFVDGGPSLKRIRPAPMGRAFKIQRRMCHVTLGLGETPYRRTATRGPAETAAGEAAPAGAAGPEGAAAKSKRTAAAKSAAGRKPAAGKKPAAKAKGARKG
jgi:large subunit ribosomal protein L22